MTLHVEWEAMRAARERLRAAEASFGALVGPTADHARAAGDAAGQFAASLSPGAEAFATSWQAVLGVCRDTCDVTAANLGALTVNLEATDVAAAAPGGGRPTRGGLVPW
ncbi:MAG: hypothetical protein ACFCVG_06895 [Kineosporiaceae bacterium]